MNKEEHQERLFKLAVRLLDATFEAWPNKLVVKIEVRDAIEQALKGTVAEGIAIALRDRIAPHCIPFDEERYLELCELAVVVGKGRSGLLKAYKIQILEEGMGL